MPISLTEAQNEAIRSAMGQSFRRSVRPIRLRGQVVGCEFDEQAMLDTILDLVDEFNFQKEQNYGSLN